jgi:WD40 repeat protein
MQGFYVSGGTVPLESPSYVERGADITLFDALSAGKFCYVLNSRQMGKSSLCVRTMARLQASGARAAFVDLTKIGGRNVTPDQWYAGLVVEVGRALGLRAEMLRNWQEERDLSPMQRFFSALRDVALEKIEAPVVVFVDEIDATRSLPFSANEFFAGIRECYNRRVHDPAYKRLTFCLLGVAVPGDLIADPTTTPFNIGERVVLADFTEAEAAPLAAGLGTAGTEVLRRILYWTNGHPFLTQSLAASAQTSGNVRSAGDVDRMVADLLFQAKARETNINLADVGNRILSGAPDPKDTAKYRADILSLYENVLKGREVIDDESNRLAAILKLAGIVRVEERRLKVRNRIYERVFDRTWIRENMPGAELRRQRRAFIKGAVRTGLVAAAVLAVIAALAWKAARERDRANYEVYVATMNLMRPMWERNDVEGIQRLLESMRDNPARGWEWDYWYRMSHLYVAAVWKIGSNGPARRYSSNGKVYFSSEGRIWEYSPASGRLVDLMPAMHRTLGGVIPFADGRHLLEYDSQRTAQVIDIQTSKRLAKIDDVFIPFVSTQPISADGRWIVGTRMSESSGGVFWTNVFRSAVLWDAETGKRASLPTGPVQSVSIAPNGRIIASIELKSSPAGVVERPIVVREFGTWKPLTTFKTEGFPLGIIFAPGSDRLATTDSGGLVQIWDLKTRKETARIRPSENAVWGVEFSQDGTWLATNSGQERVARLYDLSGPQARFINAFRDANHVSIAPDKSLILAAYITAARFYDPKKDAEMLSASIAGDRFADGAEVLDREPIARVRLGSQAYELKPLTGEVQEQQWIPGKLLFLPYTGESRSVAMREDGGLEIVDFEQRRPVLTLPNGTQPPIGLSQFPDGRRMILLYDKAMEVRDATDGHLLRRVPLAEHPSAAKVSPDGRSLAVGYGTNSLSVWDTGAWSERRLPSEDTVLGLSFSRDGKRLLAATDQDSAAVWEMPAGRLLARLRHTQTCMDAAYSPDGKRIVTAGDNTVRIWDAATFRELTSLAGHREQAARARFTSDGRSIVSVDIHGKAIVWQAQKPDAVEITQ